MVKLFDQVVPKHQLDDCGEYNKAIPWWCAVEQACKALDKTPFWTTEAAHRGGEVYIKVKCGGEVYEEVDSDLWDYDTAKALCNRMRLYIEVSKACNLSDKLSFN